MRWPPSAAARPRRKRRAPPASPTSAAALSRAAADGERRSPPCSLCVRVREGYTAPTRRVRPEPSPLMAKIKVANPVVDHDGDEITRIIWKLNKEKQIFPFLDLKIEYYDLGMENRAATDDKETIEAAQAIKKYGVGI